MLWQLRDKHYTKGLPDVMTAIHETAYPRTRSNPTDRELNELFTPTPADIAFARRHTKSAVPRLGLLVLLNTTWKVIGKNE